MAHPPCRAWSAYCGHQAKPEPGEKELGPLCVEWLRKEGGVLEHPAHSRLFRACGLPEPGKRRGDFFTLPVMQAWWGFDLPKKTWLVLCGVDPRQLEIPWSEVPAGAHAAWKRKSKHQRAATCDELAHWLVSVARTARVS